MIELQKKYTNKRDCFFHEVNSIIDNKKAINIIKEENFFQERFTKINNESLDLIKNFKNMMFLSQNVPLLATKVFSIIFLALSTFLIMKDNISVGQMISSFQLLQYISTPILELSYILLSIRSNKEHIDRIESYYNNEDIFKMDESKKVNEDSLFKTGNLEVKFANDKPLFRMKEIDIKNNGLYIIKGGNGVGKTSFVNFVLGHLSSCIVNGDYETSNSIDDYAYLFYPTLLVNGSFKDNLFGNEYDDKLLDILNIDFVEKEISNNPVNLSTGQIQKIALLRVLSSKCKYLFLDEPFSNLDDDTKNKLIRYFSELKLIKTLVLILHDDFLDQEAKQIYVIKNGILQQLF